MRSILDKIIDKTPHIQMKKIEVSIESEHQWGGYARVVSGVSDSAIRSFFSRYGTTAIGFKRFEHPVFFAGYYYIPRKPGAMTAHKDDSERIAVFQKVPLFRGAYKNAILIKSYAGDSSLGDDLLSLMSRSMYLEGLIDDIRKSGGLPVHHNTKSPLLC